MTAGGERADGGAGRPAEAEDPDAALARYAAELAAGVDASIASWVVRSVETRMQQWSGSMPGEVRALAEAAGERARATVGAEVRELLALDIDAQRDAPLSVLRRAVVHPTRVLEAAGVPHVERDEVDAAMFPDDVYALAPASYADLDPSLHEPGLAWGAAKAFVHLSRRRADGQR
jgi:hypothetical protein